MSRPIRRGPPNRGPFRGPADVVNDAGTGVNFTLTPNAGSVNATGQAPSNVQSSVMTPQPAVLNLSGVGPQLLTAFQLTPNTGALGLVGNAPQAAITEGADTASVPAGVAPSVFVAPKKAGTLNDLFQYYGTDLRPSSTGDLLIVSGTVRGQQRVLRRLLTNPAMAAAPSDYIFEPEYGAGLPAYIGTTIDTQKITATILAQMLLEDAVASTPAPVITVAQTGADNTAFSVSIAYNDAATNQPVTLTFNVGQ